MTKVLLGLIGAGIQRSLAPALHEEEGRHHGLRVHYQLIEVEGAEALGILMQAARTIGFAGLNITYPARAGAGASGVRCRAQISRAWFCSAPAAPDQRAATQCCAWGPLAS